MKIQKFIFISLLASFLSSLKITYLPELEFFLLFILIFFRNSFLFASLLIIILCSHHYVIPDEVYRFDSSSYPSIYTKKIGSIKILDIITILFFLYSLINSKFKIQSSNKFNLNYPYILLLFCLVGLVATPFVNQKVDLIFFNFRNLIIVVSTILLLKNLNLTQITAIAFLAISSWISKMLFAILIPSENPLYREIFDFKWNIYFAGDEYLSLGVYFISILFLVKIAGETPSKRLTNLIKVLIFISLVLSLIAQRKGSLIYFFVVFIIVHYVNKPNFKLLQNFLILLLPLSTFLFLLFVLPLLPDYVNLAFFDQSGLLNSSIESIYNIYKHDFFHFLFGVGPYSLYEIKGLDTFLDNEMAFGSEVGNTFRYMIWSLPFGRLFLNVGLFGFLIYIYFLIKNLNKPSYYFYLYSLVIPIFFLENSSPVSALSVGFSFVVISKYADSNIGLKYNLSSL